MWDLPRYLQCLQLVNRFAIRCFNLMCARSGWTLRPSLGHFNVLVCGFSGAHGSAKAWVKVSFGNFVWDFLWWFFFCADTSCMSYRPWQHGKETRFGSCRLGTNHFTRVDSKVRKVSLEREGGWACFLGLYCLGRFALCCLGALACFK